MDCGLTGLTCNDPSLVKPQFAKECDLHYIVDSFLRTGRLPASCSVHNATVQDATGVPDSWQELQDRTIKVRQEFEQLPADVRIKYNDDPMAWFIAQQVPADLNEPSKQDPESPKQDPEPPKSPTVA